LKDWGCANQLDLDFFAVDNFYIANNTMKDDSDVFAFVDSDAFSFATTLIMSKTPSIKNERDRVFVENYGKDHKSEVVVKPEIKESVYIGSCLGGTFKVETKAKGVTINKCENIAVILHGVVGNVEVVNCKKVQIQLNGTAPIFQVDSSDRTSIYLSPDELKTSFKVYSAKSSSTNVYTPSGEDENVEHAIPEQIVSHLHNGKLVSEVVVPGKE